MPSSTEAYLCDRFTAQEQGFYLGVEDKKASVCPPPSSRLSLNSHLCIPHISPNCGTWKPCPLWRKQNSISDLSPDDQIDSAVLSTPPLPLCHRAFLEVTVRTDKGGGLKRGRADRRREAERFFTTESWVPLDRADASSYFLAALTSGLLFPLIRVQCSR